MLSQPKFASHDIAEWIEKEVTESLRVKYELLQECAETLTRICCALSERIEQGGKLILFGNGRKCGRRTTHCCGIRGTIPLRTGSDACHGTYGQQFYDDGCGE